MQDNGLNRWPAFRERPDLYKHDPDVLLRHTLLTDALASEVGEATSVGLAWMVAKDFSIARRYPDGKAFPWRLAKDMVGAIGQQGLLKWIMHTPRSTTSG